MKRMKLFLLIFLLLGSFLSAAEAVLRLQLKIQEGFHVTTEEILVDKGWRIVDSVAELTARNNALTLQWEGQGQMPPKVKVRYQPCSEESCLLPVEEEFLTSWQNEMGKGTTSAVTTESPSLDLRKKLQLQKERRLYGAPSREKLTAWLEEEGTLEKKEGEKGNWWSSPRKSFLWFLLLIPLGILLNLTPCVLPLIPVNLAVLGMTGESRKQGILRGGIYALGMALSYGVMGCILVSAGGIAGTWQSNGWFHLGMAALFLLLVCAYCGWLPWNLQRFGQRVQGKSLGLVSLFIFGASSALLAGTCTGPILAAILLFAAELFIGGHQLLALLIPLLVGVGLALPWPFLGAGFLRILPKPGRWMRVIHLFFALVLLAFAGHSCYQGVRLLGQRERAKTGLSSAWYSYGEFQQQWKTGRFKEKMRGKKILFLFTGPACSACETLKKTLMAPRVEKLLSTHYLLVVVSIEKRDDLEFAKEMSVQGVPCLLQGKLDL